MGYWEERNAETQAKLTEKGAKAAEQQLAKYYKKSMFNVLGQFEETYSKVLSSMEEGREPTPADLYKLDTYWKMQGQLKVELQKLGDKQAEYLSKVFTEHYMQIYESIALKGDLFSAIDYNAAQQLINQIWCADGKNWSSRIWTNTSRLQEALNEHLLECVITGKNPRALRELLVRDFNVSFNRADSLVRTEMAQIQTQAARQRYLDYGCQEVEVLADKDERQCEVCGKLHKQRFPIGGKMPIPAHPKCRCCIVPVVD